MINEWEEFCAYTGTVSYTASKKSDTSWLGRFTFATSWSLREWLGF